MIKRKVSGVKVEDRTLSVSQIHCQKVNYRSRKISKRLVLE